MRVTGASAIAKGPLDIRAPEIGGTTSDLEHGAVFTRRWMVELILDIADYKTDKNLYESLALEPACGEGAFLVPMVERLSDTCKRDKRDLLDTMGQYGPLICNPRT